MNDILEANYTYDAFISYRHIPHDKAIAEKLQKLLESYKPPKRGKYKNTNKIKRVFRDESELPTSGDLGTDIKKALSQSAYLIVVCSEETAGSAWCMQEIRYFKQLHNGNNEKILTLLVSGDPKEVFPKELCYETKQIALDDGNVGSQTLEVEPLAANIVAKNTFTSLKKLRGEFLRLAAPILGCGYDDLYRRHQRRFVRNFVIVTAVISVSVLAFSGFSYAQAIRIQSQSKEIIVKTQELQTAYSELTEKNDKLEKSNKKLSEQIQETNKQKNLAEENSLEAEKQTVIAKKNANKAKQQERIAILNQKEAEENLRIATEQKKKVIKEKSLRALEAAEMMIDEGNKVAATSLIMETIKSTSDQSEYFKEKTDYLLAKSTSVKMFEKYAVLQQNGKINGCYVSTDGQFVFTASDDKTVTMYKSHSGEKVKTFIHSAAVMNMWVSDKYIYTVTKDFIITKWDIASNKKIKQMKYPIKNNKNTLILKLINNDHNLFLYYRLCDADKNYVAKIDFESGLDEMLYTLEKYTYSFESSNDGRYFLIERDNKLIINDTINGTQKDISFKNYEIEKMLFNGNKNIIVIAKNMTTNYCDILIYDLKGNFKSKIISNNTLNIAPDEWLVDANISPDEKYLALGWYSGRCSIYNLQNNVFLQNIDANAAALHRINFTGDSKYLILGASLSGKIIKVWKYSNNYFQDYKEVTPPNMDVSGLSLNNNNGIMAISSIDGSTHLYSINQAFNEQIVEMDISELYNSYSNSVNDIKMMSKDCKYIILSKYNNKEPYGHQALKVIDKLSGNIISQYKGTKNIVDATPSNDFSFALIQEPLSNKYILDLKTGKKLFSAKIPMEYEAISLIDSKNAYILTFNGYLHKVNIITGKVLSTVKLNLNLGAISTWKLNVDDKYNRVTVIGQYPRGIEEIGFVFQLSTGKKMYDLYHPDHYGEILTNVNGSFVYQDVQLKQTLRTTIPTYDGLIIEAKKQTDYRILSKDEKNIYGIE